ncbi:MAG: FAD-dependent oxidoreductase [Anaerolineales bacterium]
MSHIVTWEEPEIHLLLSKESKRLYQELSQSLPIDIQYRETGSLALVENPDGMETFQQTIQRLQRWGVRCQILDVVELTKSEPIISPDIGGGVYFEDDAQANPLYTTQALAIAAREHGAIIDPFNEVVSIETSSDSQKILAVQTVKERIPTECVVIAAGAWSSQIGKMVNIEVPVSPRKGTLVITTPLPQDYLNCKIILAAGYMESLKEGTSGGIAVAANIQQVANGNLLLGSSRQFVGFDGKVDPKVVSLMMKRNLRFFPDLKRVTALRMWAGFRPYTPDLLPIISEVEQVPGLYIAAGHEGIGITEAPITGKLITQIILKQTPNVPIGPLSYSRFTNN